MIKKIIKIGAPWCGPCKALGEQLKAIDSVEIEKIDVDEDPSVSEKYNIRNIPVLIFLNEKDEEVTRKVGMVTASVINDIIKEHES